MTYKCDTFLFMELLEKKSVTIHDRLYGLKEYFFQLTRISSYNVLGVYFSKKISNLTTLCEKPKLFFHRFQSMGREKLPCISLSAINFV